MAVADGETIRLIQMKFSDGETHRVFILIEETVQMDHH